jgi:dCMP deaminase
MRQTWEQYFMDIAQTVSSRATCDRKHVGAVIVRDRTILSTGYNGSVIGMPHCDDEGHDLVNNHCVRTVHSEQNAICQAAKNGVAVDGADMYINTFPCWQCFKIMANSGIRRVYYLDAYRTDERVLKAAEKTGVELIQVKV